MTPLVSICIPAYRQPAFVARSVASVFAQSLQDFEVVVTDDSDTDEVERALAPWRDDPRLIYRHNPTRLGSPENWNAAMQLARSDLIKFLHHDDWFASNDALEHFVGVMDKNPQIDFAFSAANACEDDGRLIFVHRPADAQIALLRHRPWELQFGNFIGAPSATIFRQRPGFRFDGRLRWVVDIEAYLQLIGRQPKFEFISATLVCITSNGAHQVTRSVVAEPVSRVVEHLQLYASHRPPHIGGRIDGVIFLSRLMAACRPAQFDAISKERNDQPRSPEELIAMLALKLKSTVAASVVAAKKGIYEFLFSREKSGRNSYSQCGEDMIVDFLMMWLGSASVTYLDIGAHHPTWLSNTYHFYRLGHRGVLIEPDADLCKGLHKKRPADKVLNLAVGTEGDDVMSMYVMTTRTLNTLDKSIAEALQAAGRERIEAVREVRRLGINEVLAEHFSKGAPDFVSLDIEGLDLAILGAWNFARFRPKVFCVETLTYTQDNSERKLTEIVDLMASRRYRVYADTYVNTIFVCEDAWRGRPIYD